MSWQTFLSDRRQEIPKKRITVGFDGFVDTIARPLRRAATGDTPAQPFGTIRDLGEFLISKAEKSCSIELSMDSRQLGGNLPYLSRAAGNLGLSVHCIGMLGEGGTVDPVFRDMPCILYPFAPPGQSMCLEFSDGKVLLAPDCPMSQDPWTSVLKATDGRAPVLFQEADLAALVNWSELSFSYGLWQHTYEAVAQSPADFSRYAFFDFCDVSRKSEKDLDAVLRLTGAFSKYRTTILSLNENEALVTSERLLNGLTDLVQIAQSIRAAYGLTEVLIHTIHESILVTPRGIAIRPTYFVEHPKISTGAGDNFNAASCFAAVMGMCDADRVEFANMFAHIYVAKGYSPSLPEVFA